MSKTLVNLTLYFVNNAIDTVLLERYPDESYVNLFAYEEDCRLELVAYVLSRVPNRYRALDVKQVDSVESMLFGLPTEHLLLIESLVAIGIHRIFHQHHSERLNALLY